jgi:hypothetical protein
MTDPDDALLRSLAAADATHPPAPGAEFSPRALGAAATRAQRRRLAAGLVILAAAAIALARPAADRNGEDTTGLAHELSLQLDRMQRAAKDWASHTLAAAENEAAAIRSAHAAAELRFELAHARALPLFAATPALEQPR